MTGLVSVLPRKPCVNEGNLLTSMADQRIKDTLGPPYTLLHKEVVLKGSILRSYVYQNGTLKRVLYERSSLSQRVLLLEVPLYTHNVTQS